MNRLYVPLALFAVLLVVYLAAPWLGLERDERIGAGKPVVELSYVEWEGAKAATHLMKAVIQERIGYRCEVIPVSAAAMWQSVATGDTDAMLAGWLPGTHAQYYDALRDRVEDLGPNLEGARIGLVVPEYVTIATIGELGEHPGRFDRRVVGIDPGAGIMGKTEDALKAYDLDGFELVSSSGAAMTAELGDAVRNEQWIVVTGWTPHWKFARYDLKFLEDPKGVYGSAEKVHTVARLDLKADMPRIYRLLDRFQWSMEEISTLMEANQEPGAEPYATARRWMEQHPERVDAWLGR